MWQKTSNVSRSLKTNEKTTDVDHLFELQSGDIKARLSLLRMRNRTLPELPFTAGALEVKKLFKAMSVQQETRGGFKPVSRNHLQNML
jgi:hypothetical protein